MPFCAANTFLLSGWCRHRVRRTGFLDGARGEVVRSAARRTLWTAKRTPGIHRPEWPHAPYLISLFVLRKNRTSAIFRGRWTGPRTI